MQREEVVILMSQLSTGRPLIQYGCWTEEISSMGLFGSSTCHVSLCLSTCIRVCSLPPSPSTTSTEAFTPAIPSGSKILPALCADREAEFIYPSKSSGWSTSSATAFLQRPILLWPEMYRKNLPKPVQGRLLTFRLVALRPRIHDNVTPTISITSAVSWCC